MKPRIAIPVPNALDPAYAERALPQYVQAVEQAGGEPVRVELTLTNAEIARLATTCHGVLLPGSKADVDPQKYGAAERDPSTAEADPRRDNADELLLQDAYNMRKPVLGICYGVQILNVWRTGTLIQDLKTGTNHEAGRAVAQAHRIDVDPSSMLAQIVLPSWDVPGEPLRGWVNSSHHQAIANSGDGLKVVAWSEPDQIVEAVEGTAPDHFVLGVQWHPERTTEQDEASRAIFRAFIDAAQERISNPRTPVSDFEAIKNLP